MSHPTIIVAGYGAWAKAKLNPAAEVLKLLAKQQWPEYKVVLLEVPVVCDDLDRIIEKAFLEFNPVAWLGLGISAGSEAIKPEMVAVNWLHFRVPDANGYKATLKRIVKDGPLALEATIPNKAISDALNAATIPSKISFSAGTHMCNQMLYSTRHYVEQNKLSTMCGFIHLPQSAENVSDNDTAPLLPSMPLEMMAKAIHIAVDVIYQQIDSSIDGDSSILTQSMTGD